jgi:hypothetical protein
MWQKARALKDSTWFDVRVGDEMWVRAEPPQTHNAISPEGHWRGITVSFTTNIIVPLPSSVFDTFFGVPKEYVELIPVFAADEEVQPTTMEEWTADARSRRRET